MGKQSSRLIYREKDIKDLVYQGNFLHKLYKGNELVWEKLYRYFVQVGVLLAFDLESKKYINDTTLYFVTELKRNNTSAIAILYEIETGKVFFAISYDMLRWKEIKILENVNKERRDTIFYSFMSSYDGFFVCQINNTSKKSTIYYVGIDFDLKYKIKELYKEENTILSPSQYGISNYFFFIETFSSSSNHLRYNLHRVSKNGDHISKQLKGNFEKDDVNMIAGGLEVLADGNGNVFLICYDVDARNGGTVIFKVQGMDTDFIYTVFWARNSKILNGARCGIDIMYDSFQTMFIAHRGFEEEPGFVENGNISDKGYYNMEFYKINSEGNVLLVSEKRDHEIGIKCFGIPGRDYLTIKFGGRIDSSYEGADVEGIIYFSNVTKGISSSTNNFTSAIFDYNKQETEPGFVGMYSWKEYLTGKNRSVVIFIDNLFFQESENNYVAVTTWE